MGSKIKFVGRITPEATCVSIDSGAKVHWKIETGIEVDFEILIDRSEVVVECTYDGSITQNHLDGMFVRAFDIVRATVDLLSFSIGRGLIVVLDKIIDRCGNESGILLQEPPLA